MLLSRVHAELWKFGTQERAARNTPLMLFATALENAAAVRYSTPRLQGAAAGYSVTTGRVLIITRVLFRADAANARTSSSCGVSTTCAAVTM